MKLSELKISEYHAHIYYVPWTRDSALGLREVLMQRFEGRVVFHSPSDVPRGPHIQPMFGIDIRLDVFTEFLSFLLVNHGPHSVLIHPVSGNELLDHTHHALWLGMPQPLQLGVLV